MNYRVSKKGFTLIELLIVISIIGILAVALLPNVLNAPVRARDAARKSDIATIVKAVETYNVDNGGYPGTALICFNGTPLPAPLDKLNSYFSGGVPPKDPAGDATRVIVPGCNGGYAFCKKDGSPFSYLIVSKMENKDANKHAVPDLNSCDGLAAGVVSPGTAVHVVAQ